jgi:threonine/homoserine/homoserine lactone efflux protein
MTALCCKEFSSMEFNNGFLLSLSLCLEIGLANMAMINISMQRGFAQGLCSAWALVSVI